MPDAEAVYGNFQRVDNDRKPQHTKWTSSMPSGDIFPAVAKGMTGILRTLLVRYSRVRDLGFMDVSLPMYDGFWLTIQLAAQTRFVYVDEVLMHKRDHVASDSKIGDAARHLSDLRIIHGKLQPLLRQNVSMGEAGAINEKWRRRFGRSGF